MEEEKVYLKAISILNDALDGKNINPIALATANQMFLMLWSRIYEERLKKEQIKDALREVWEETILEKKDK